MKSRKIIIASLATMVIYVLSYLTLKSFKPEAINTNNGPIKAYQIVYYLLRHIDSNTPDFFIQHSRKQRIEGTVEWINKGNGHLYFAWNDKEYRAALACDPNSIAEGDRVTLDIEYELLTYDDFSNHRIPYIVSINKV